MSSSGTNTSSPFPKWPLIVALGATGVGLSYWYLRRRQTASVKRTTSKHNSSAVEEDSPKATAVTPLQLAQQYKEEGNGFFKKGKYNEAISCYNRAIEMCPDTNAHDLATFFQNRAAAYEHLKKWRSVIGDCTEALQRNGKYEKALYRRARAYESLKDWEKCLDDVTAVCLLQNFQNRNALQMADLVLKELGKQHAAEAIKNRTPKLPSRQFIKTYFMAFSEDPVYKLLCSNEAQLNDNGSGWCIQGGGKDMEPSNLWLNRFMKAKRAFQLENFEEIIPACTEEINSSEAESQYLVEAMSLRASFHLLSGSYKEALEDIETILGTDSANVNIKVNCLIKRASLYMQLEDNEKCLNDFEIAVELGSNISDVFHHRGQVNLLMDKVEEARSDFARAVELNPNFAIAVVQKCYADYRYFIVTQNKTMDDLEDFERATERFPHCGEVFVLYGQVLTEKQQFEKANTMYLKAMEIEPQNATVLVHRGLLLLQWKGDIDHAVQLIRSAIDLDAKCEFAYETLGTVEVQRGNLVLAIDLFDKAIALARTEMEMTHLFSLRDAASSQLKVTTNMGIGPQLLKMNG